MVKYIKNGKTVFKGGTVVENGIVYSGVTESWLLNHGWEKHEPLISDEELLYKAKLNKIAELENVDSSSCVNEFILNDLPIWLNKADRVGLVNAVNSAMILGLSSVKLGLGNNSFDVPCNLALLMLAQLEMYALECYNITLQHRKEIDELESIDEVNNFDLLSGYPEKLTFNI